ncbi:MAG: low molecular weight phosphotyrosine protein phosphatase [Akkermansiaceae bacterium]|nr:low molecular weight phosphotyrosine protein phosphatase [Akkermansiaceae bacterium]
MTAPLRPVRVLFVCMGNICRSPAAEIVFAKIIESHDAAGWCQCDSAGTIGYHAGSPPDPRMAATLAARGYRIFGKSRKVQPQDLAEFDHILVADEENLQDLIELDASGAYRDKIRLLTDHCVHHQASHVPDPYYGGQAGFERVADLVEDACQGLFDQLKSGRGELQG